MCPNCEGEIFSRNKCGIGWSQRHLLRDVAAEMSIGEYLIRAEWREKSLRVCKLKETNGNPVGGRSKASSR